MTDSDLQTALLLLGFTEDIKYFDYVWSMRSEHTLVGKRRDSNRYDTYVNGPGSNTFIDPEDVIKYVERHV